jgi:hypothetical protein
MKNPSAEALCSMDDETAAKKPPVALLFSRSKKELFFHTKKRTYRLCDPR